jgi:hypothetical protein
MRRVAMLATLLAVVLLPACGDDGDDYVDQMEEACDVRDLAIEGIVQPIPDAFDAEYMDLVVRGSVDVITDYVAAVEEIGPPGGSLDDEHAEYLALLTSTLERYETAVGDAEATAAIFNQPAPEFRTLEEELGLPTCGTAGNGSPSAEDAEAD